MIAICTPARDVVNATFTSDLVALVQTTKQPVLFLTATGSLLPNLRIGLVDAALNKLNASHIFFIDSDMRFPPDSLDRLLKHDKDIVGANYKQRTQQEWTAFYNGKFIHKDSGLELADSIGFGVTLIKQTVFKSIHKPWFALPYDPTIGKCLSDDVYFCRNARGYGHTIWVDHDLKVKHTGLTEF